MTCPPTVLATDAVDVDGPVMMNVEKSRRSWSQIFDSQNIYSNVDLNNNNNNVWFKFIDGLKLFLAI